MRRFVTAAGRGRVYAVVGSINRSEIPRRCHGRDMLARTKIRNPLLTAVGLGPTCGAAGVTSPGTDAGVVLGASGRAPPPAAQYRRPLDRSTQAFPAAAEAR